VAGVDGTPNHLFGRAFARGCVSPSTLPPDIPIDRQGEPALSKQGRNLPGRPFIPGIETQAEAASCGASSEIRSPVPRSGSRIWYRAFLRN